MIEANVFFPRHKSIHALGGRDLEQRKGMTQDPFVDDDDDSICIRSNMMKYGKRSDGASVIRCTRALQVRRRRRCKTTATLSSSATSTTYWYCCLLVLLAVFWTNSRTPVTFMASASNNNNNNNNLDNEDMDMTAAKLSAMTSAIQRFVQQQQQQLELHQQHQQQAPQALIADWFQRWQGQLATHMHMEQQQHHEDHNHYDAHLQQLIQAASQVFDQQQQQERTVVQQRDEFNNFLFQTVFSANNGNNKINQNQLLQDEVMQHSSSLQQNTGNTNKQTVTAPHMEATTATHHFHHQGVLPPFVLQEVDEVLTAAKQHSTMDHSSKHRTLPVNYHQMAGMYHQHQHKIRGGKMVQDRRRALYERTLHRHYNSIFDASPEMRRQRRRQHRRQKKLLARGYQQQQQQQQQQQDENDEQDMTDLAYNATQHLIRETFATYLSAVLGPVESSDQQSEQQPPPPQQQETLDRTTSLHVAFPPMPTSMQQANRQQVKTLFHEAYDAYMYRAWPEPELKPMECTGGTFHLVKIQGLQLIDALDTLLVMGNATEFARSVERLKELHQQHLEDPNTQGWLGVDQNVSLFETNIRVLGGLLSAHQLAVAYIAQQEESSSSSSSPRFHVWTDQVWTPKGTVRWGYDDDEEEEVAQGKDGAGVCQADNASSATTSTTDAATDGDDVDEASAAATASEQRQTLETDAASPEKVVPICDSANLSLQDCVVAATASSSSTVSSTQDTTSEKNVTKSKTTLVKNRQLWKYDGFLLDMAYDLGKRLLPAFNTRTGIPYGTINLLYGVPEGETSEASLAGGGTLSLEMELLSRLTGDDRFGKAAKGAARSLWSRKSSLNLYGKHIDIQDYRWTETLSGIGSNSDSFLEYLVKHYVLFPEEEDDTWIMLRTAYEGVFRENRQGEFYADVDMNYGQSRGSSRRVLESLMAFYPGMQILLGEVTPAARSANAFLMVREWVGFLPERFHFGHWKVDSGFSGGAGRHPLRPELLESVYFLHRATQEPQRASSDGSKDSASGWLWAADFALRKIADTTPVGDVCPGAHAGIRDVRPHTTGMVDGSKEVHKYNEMPSFFLSETLKYLYLTFDPENVLHTDHERQWIFTTEAHPIHHVSIASSTTTTTSNGGANKSATTTAANPVLQELVSLRHIVQDKLYKRRVGRSKRPRDEVKERWMDLSSSYSIRQSISTSRTGLERQWDGIATSAENSDTDSVLSMEGLVQPFFHPDQIALDTFNETGRGTNLAHLAMAPLGSQTLLRKACPNFQSSDWFWLRALQGGSNDYSDMYISVLTDDLRDHPMDFVVLGAAEALGFHGSGSYLGQPNEWGKVCPIDRSSINSAAKSKGVVEAVVGAAESDQQNHGTDMDSVEITSDIGAFEVGSYPEGGGFFVHHLDTQEKIIATFVRDEGPDNTPFLLVYTMFPSSPRQDSAWHRIRSRFRSLFPTVPPTGKGGADAAARDFERKVVFSDFQMNSFTCEIDVVSKQLEASSGSRSGSSASQEGEEVLLRMPCAPGMFGQSHIAWLVENGSLQVEAPILGPLEDDLYGCVSGIDAEVQQNDLVPSVSAVNQDAGEAATKSCENEAIHIVQRGECTFYNKAKTRKTKWDAKAVIVINSEEDELFVMSHGEGEDITEEVPPTVLVTGFDGEDLVSLVNEHANGERPTLIVARISLDRQMYIIDSQGKISNPLSTDPVRFPVIHGSKDHVQILSKSGWGVQAINPFSDNDGNMDEGGGLRDWQLHLLQHNGPR